MRTFKSKNDLLACRYDIGKVLGAGSFGVVREAIDKNTGRHFACKTIPKIPKRGVCTPRYRSLPVPPPPNIPPDLYLQIMGLIPQTLLGLLVGGSCELEYPIDFEEVSLLLGRVEIAGM